MKAFLGRGIGAKAHISFMCLKVKKIGAHGWTHLVRGKGELKLRGILIIRAVGSHRQVIRRSVWGWGGGE